jgi:methionyl-tRNA synthetase
MDTQLNTALSAYFIAHPWIVLVIIWSIIWKMIALWKAAKNDHLVIFIVLAFLNTIGIAEIAYLLYLYIKQKKQEKNIM